MAKHKKQSLGYAALMRDHEALDVLRLHHGWKLSYGWVAHGKPQCRCAWTVTDENGFLRHSLDGYNDPAEALLESAKHQQGVT